MQKEPGCYINGYKICKMLKSFADLEHLPGRYHQLRENRKGQWACDLDLPFRLIFEPLEKPIPTDKHGKYILIEIKGVEVVEISNYHMER